MIGVRLMMMVRREIDVATRKHGAEGCEGSRGTSKKIEIDPQYITTSFIATYRDTSNNYTEVKFIIVMLFC